MKTQIVQVVRRYGRVGGMEKYVWELSHGLVRYGCKVTVICEFVDGSPDPCIEIVCVDSKTKRFWSRWQGMRYFRSKVSEVLLRRKDWTHAIIHSHERSIGHNVSTFHGSPISRGTLSQLLSRRIRNWVLLERDELLSREVQFVVPVSSNVSLSIRDLYGDLDGRLTQPGWPGVGIPSVNQNGKEKRLNAKRFLFVGEEWKRKGLPKAVRLFKQIKNDFDSEAEFHIFGPAVESIPSSISSVSSIYVHGWNADIDWESYDALIHLAENEPFGMVISEARSYGVPVIVSGNVGAIDLSFRNLLKLDGDQITPETARKVLRFLDQCNDREPDIPWTWDDLIRFYLEDVYSRLQLGSC